MDFPEVQTADSEDALGTESVKMDVDDAERQFRPK